MKMEKAMTTIKGERLEITAIDIPENPQILSTPGLTTFLIEQTTLPATKPLTPIPVKHMPSSAGTSSGRSPLWQHFSWCVGDRHADALCLLIDLYCAETDVDPVRLYHSPGKMSK